MVRNLRKLRISKGMSQQQLADVIGISQQSINKYENHNVEPDISVLIKIADFFETSVDYLIGHVSLLDQGSSEFEPTKDEVVLLRSFRRLSKKEKESIRMVVTLYLNNREAPET